MWRSFPLGLRAEQVGRFKKPTPLKRARGGVVACGASASAAMKKPAKPVATRVLRGGGVMPLGGVGSVLLGFRAGRRPGSSLQ